MTLSFTEAQQRISAAVRALTESESRPPADCPLADSLGAVLATDLIAPKDVPSSDCAAVDGYGFCHATLPPDHCLQISGQAQAGHPLPHPFKAGSAIAITTGAPIPQAENPQHSPDTIAMHEDCEVIKDKVRLPANIKKGSNFRPKGENIQKGETALKQGTQIGAAEIGLCAAMGFAKLSVMRALRVGVLSTGDELCDVADVANAPDAHPNGLIDSNRPMLMALLKADHHHSTDGGIIKDDRTATSLNLQNLASNNDAVLVSGGSAGGSEDHTRQAIRHAGGTIHFAGINIKPGRPFAMGQIGSCPIFCLPGNPVAVFVTYRLLVAEALTRLSGARPRPLLRLPVRCGFSATHKQGRTDFVRVVLRDSDSDSDGGLPIAIPHGRFGAGVLTSLTGADGLLEISADKGHIKEGDECAFIPLR